MSLRRAPPPVALPVALETRSKRTMSVSRRLWQASVSKNADTSPTYSNERSRSRPIRVSQAAFARSHERLRRGRKGSTGFAIEHRADAASSADDLEFAHLSGF